MAGQVWVQSALGGFFANPRLSEELRYQSIPLMKLRQFVKPLEGYGAHVGDKILFDKISRLAVSGGALSENIPIPETNFTVTQGTVTVTEYGNGVPFTGKLEALSQWNPEDPIQRTLRDDMALVLDQAAGVQFRSTQYVYAPTGTVPSPTGSFTAGYVGGPTVAIPEELRYDIPQDSGRAKKIVWYAILGFQIAWLWNTDTETRIIRVWG